jgi:hypothetical protein
VRTRRADRRLTCEAPRCLLLSTALLRVALMPLAHALATYRPPRRRAANEAQRPVPAQRLESDTCRRREINCRADGTAPLHEFAKGVWRRMSAFLQERRKQAWEALHPETRHGAVGRGGYEKSGQVGHSSEAANVLAFHKETAQRTGALSAWNQFGGKVI